MAKRSNRKPAPVAPAAAADRTEPGPMPLWLGITLIIAAAFWVYLPVLHGNWLWDDDWYVTDQLLLRDVSGLWKFWFQPGSWVDYYPVSETLLWIEWHLWGNEPSGYHVVNLALHTGNALLVWRLLAKLGLRHAWLGGILFAVHPVAVDSVAWISETKNTVALFFGLLALGAWVDFQAREKPRDYAWALFFFLLAMLGKISVSPVPLILLLYAWWRRRGLSLADLRAVTPFLAVALAVNTLCFLCYQSYWGHVRQPLEVLPHLEPAVRLVLAGQLLDIYSTHFIWPVDLLPVYPQWTVHPDSPWSYLPWLVPLIVFVVLALKIKTWGRHAVLGLGYFLLLLAPFLGLVTAPYMYFTWLMDHILYIPMIGLIGLIVAAVGSVQDRIPASCRILLTAGTTLIIALLALEAHAYAMVYTDEASLWSYTLAYNPDSWLAHYNLGNEFFIIGRYPQAIAHYERAVQLHPNYVEAHNNLGLAYAQTGRLPEAKTQFEAALRLVPTYAAAQRNLAHAQALLNAAPAQP